MFSQLRKLQLINSYSLKDSEFKMLVEVLGKLTQLESLSLLNIDVALPLLLECNKDVLKRLKSLEIQSTFDTVNQEQLELVIRNCSNLSNLTISFRNLSHSILESLYPLKAANFNTIKVPDSTTFKQNFFNNLRDLVTLNLVTTSA